MERPKDIYLVHEKVETESADIFSDKKYTAIESSNEVPRYFYRRTVTEGSTEEAGYQYGGDKSASKKRHQQRQSYDCVDENKRQIYQGRTIQPVFRIKQGPNLCDRIEAFLMVSCNC